MLRAFHLHSLPVSWWVSHTYPCMEFAGTSLRKRKHWRRMVWRKARVTHLTITWWRCKGCDFPWIICWSALLLLQHSFESVIKAHVPCIGQFLPLQGCFWQPRTVFLDVFWQTLPAWLHVFSPLKLVCWQGVHSHGLQSLRWQARKVFGILPRQPTGHHHIMCVPERNQNLYGKFQHITFCEQSSGQLGTQQIIWLIIVVFVFIMILFC